MEDEKITISLAEYKELLIIKGRYEELQSSRWWLPPINKTTITYNGKPLPEEPITPTIRLASTMPATRRWSS